MQVRNIRNRVLYAVYMSCKLTMPGPAESR